MNLVRNYSLPLSLLPNFVGMKRFIVCFSVAMMLHCLPISAQFNTISSSHHRMKVERIVETENPSLLDEFAEDDSGMVTNEEMKNDSLKWVSQYLSVSYPLKQIKINSSFGWRKDPITGKAKSFHNGVDLYARRDKVMAMLPGVVERVGNDRRAGLFVVLRHGDFQVSYCHLSKILISKGEIVAAGDVVGISGNTGSRTTGEHLHLVAKNKDGKAFNPTILIDFVRKTKSELLDKLLSSYT